MKKRAAGQMVAEYAALLAMALLLVLALIALFKAQAANGGRLIDLVSFDVP